MRTAREVTLPLHLDRAALKPLPAQVVAGLRGLLDAGVLRSGDTVPSSRSLAAQLGVSRGTVMAAYEQLLAEGWFVAEAGSATRVNPRLREVRPTASGVPVTPRVGAPPVAPSSGGRSNPPAPDAAATVDLRPGRPWQGDIVGPQWKAAWRRAADQPLDADVPVLGWPPLRTAIADHLRRMRALVRSPEQVVVTAGGREGLALVLRAAGLASIGVEEPGYLSLRRVPPLLGIPAVPLAADEQGLRTADLPANVTPDAVLVTPSHQYPLGGSLPIDRRQALLAWARAHGVLVIEDDYDSELRYTTQPLPTLTALDEVDGQVVLLGTFSKTLSPSLATGFVVVPPSMLASVVRVREAVGTPVSLVAQRALAHYIAGGALDAHTQRMRNLYRRRRAIVVRALRDLPGVRVLPMDGGLHAVVEHGRPEREVTAALEERGVLVSPLSAYWSGTSGRNGLVFGFGGVDDLGLARGLAEIRALLARPLGLQVISPTIEI